MSPEQAEGRRDIGPASDIYSLGAILYALLAGRPPLQGTTPIETLKMVVGTEPVSPSQLQPRFARDLVTICLKCLHKDPARRYETAGALADDLRRFLHDEPIRRGRAAGSRRPGACAGATRRLPPWWLSSCWCWWLELWYRAILRTRRPKRRTSRRGWRKWPGRLRRMPATTGIGPKPVRHGR